MKVISDLGIEIDTSVKSEDYEIDEEATDSVESTEDDLIEATDNCTDEGFFSYDIDIGNDAIDDGKDSIKKDGKPVEKSGKYKLHFSSDFQEQSRWYIYDENDNLVNVVDVPIFTFKRACLNIYEGDMKNLVGRITDPLNNPLAFKDTFNLELNGESFGNVKMHPKLKYLVYKSKAFNIELHAGLTAKMYKGNQLIAEGRVHFWDGMTITYWNKDYKMEIIMVYFCHVLNMYKRRERDFL